MKEGPARGRVRAKTGSLGDTTTLAGYAQTTSGETLVFALFLNHRTLEGKQALALVDELCAALAELPPEKEGKTKKGENQKARKAPGPRHENHHRLRQQPPRPGERALR